MKKNNKNIAIFAFSLLAMVGTYNAVMINSESSMGNSKDFTHLDDMYGSSKVSRKLAVATQWKKLGSETAAQTVIETESTSAASSNNSAPVATIQQALAMKLVEVNNPKKWAKGLTSAQFTGSIETNNGVIESLNAALPDNNSIEISFSEMNGNTFEYDLNGEVYSGMMYQVDQASYMITMTNGPLEGTRMRFATENNSLESQNEYLAENHNVEVQNFGSEPVETPAMDFSETTVTNAETASFNFNI